jgi:hypothetical protein
LIEIQQPNIHNINEVGEDEEDGILEANEAIQRNNIIQESDTDSESEIGN